MKLSEFDFDLPDDLIATRPIAPRSAARLLVFEGDRMVDAHVCDLVDWLRAGDLLVLNDTKVLPARLSGIRQRDEARARIEVTLLEPQSDGTWRALLKPLRKIRDGETLVFAPNFSATLVAREAGQAVLRFHQTGIGFDAALEREGMMPLPPYIAAKRASDGRDKSDYQTVWAKQPGAVAAPTASLHFDPPLLAALQNKGVEQCFVTLHVGAGTFLPVKVDDIADHKMHAERGEVTQKAADQINATIATGGRVIAVGTTALRLIETAARASGHIMPWKGATDIFITPGFDFKIAQGLMTNFHLPKSTLMMLVAAFAGHDQIKDIYNHAIKKEYRFFSYGDASLLLPTSTSDA